MKKTKNSKQRKRSSPWRLLLYIVIIIILFLFFVLKYFAPEPTEIRRPISTEESTDRLVFRDDAVLHFLSPDGNTQIEITVEIAQDDQARTLGLMGRTRMEEKQGMLFVFPDEEYRSFWMLNTPLPLDIIYVDASLRIVTIKSNTVPYSEESIPSSAPAQYVIEVNAGFCARHGITENGKVSWVLKVQKQ